MADEEHAVASERQEEDKKQQNSLGCGVLGRFPVLSILIFAAVGIAIGVGLSYWIPETSEEASTKTTLLRWIGLAGDLFIRALKCVVLPLVFINVTISVVEMMFIGKASTIGWKTIGLYLMTTLIASTIGVIAIVAFMPLFQTAESYSKGPPIVSLGCDAEGSMLTKEADGTVACSADVTDVQNTYFIIDDISGTFVQNSGGIKNDMSLSDTLYDGVFRKIVTSNIFESFVGGNFASVVFFAIIFGVALAKMMMRRNASNSVSSTTMALMKELDEILMQMIHWIIMCTPFAVLSLIAKAIGSQNDLKKEFANVGFLVLAACCAFLVHFIVVDICVFYAMTRWNPFTYLKQIVPAQTMAFASASSAATIPVTLQCVQNTGRVPEPITRFVVPLGATINMDGSAIYIPITCVWLAVLNGITPNAGQYILLIILATVGSAGAAPVPSASLVLMITAYNTVFNQAGTPFGFSFILAIDWFVDRLRTVLNVTGDTVVSAITAGTSDLEQFERDADALAKATGMEKEMGLEKPAKEISVSEDTADAAAKEVEA